MILECKNARDGELVIVDEVDYPKISKYKWTILRQKRQGYTIRYVTRKIYENGDWSTARMIYLHREIMNPDDGMVVDHINGDGLDNRRENLRIVTHQQNALNRRRGRSAFGKTEYDKTI